MPKHFIHQHALIAERFSDKEVVAVYGSDELRLEKVQAMRQQKTDILITTTILERGVTFDAVQLLFMVPIIESSLLQHLSKLWAESIEDKNSITAKFIFT